MYFSLVFLGWVCHSLKAADFWIETEMENRNKNVVSYPSPSPIHFIMKQRLLWNILILTLDNIILDTHFIGLSNGRLNKIWPATWYLVLLWAARSVFICPGHSWGWRHLWSPNLPVSIGANGYQPMHVEWCHTVSKVTRDFFCLFRPPWEYLEVAMEMYFQAS